MKSRQSIEQLASAIADEAMKSGTKLEQKIEALKALNGYLAITQKGRKKPDDDEHSGPTFDDFRANLAEVENGRPEGRGRGARLVADRRARHDEN